MWLCLQSAVLLITSQFIIAKPNALTCLSPYHYACENDKCITSSCVCDGQDDCGDASDEKDCKDNRLGNLDVHQLVENLNVLGAGTRCLSFPHCHTNIQTVIVNAVNIPSDGHKAEAGGKEKKKKFKLYSERVNWHGGVVHCASNGMGLASIESEEEQNEVSNLIKQTDTTHCKDEIYCNRWWLGASDLHDYGNYSWYSNGRPLSYRNFRKGEPNALGTKEDCLDDKEHCVEIVAGNKYDNLYWDDEWNDKPCTDRLYFVCEYFE